MNSAWNLPLIGFLLAVNGLLVAAEYALVKARGFRRDNRSRAGGPAARLTLRIQADIEAYLATCRLGITMASVGLGWAGQPFVAALLEPWFRQPGMSGAVLHTGAFAIGFLTIAALLYIVGEQLPKTLAIQRAVPVSLWTAWPLHLCHLALAPLARVLGRASRLLLCLCGLDREDRSGKPRDEVFEKDAADSCKADEIHASRAAMLRTLFASNRRRVGEIMIPADRVQRLELNGARGHNLAVIRDSGHSRWPLIDTEQDDVPLGIVLSKDVYAAVLNGEAEPWRKLENIRRDAVIVSVARNIVDLFEMMLTKRVHMACVVDDCGRLAGIVTLEDLLGEVMGESECNIGEAIPEPAPGRPDAAPRELDRRVSMAGSVNDRSREPG